MPINSRVVCSTISLRNRSLSEALPLIRGAGFAGIDLGALPGVCDHVPEVLNATAVDQVAARVAPSGLNVISINADMGDQNLPLDAAQVSSRDRHLHALLDLCHAVGSPALVLPNGWQNPEPHHTLAADFDLIAASLRHAAEVAEMRGVAVWVEAHHSFRLSNTTERAIDLMNRLRDVNVGIVMDVSHIVAAGDDVQGFIAAFADRIVHVHLRDAVRGDIHRSIGNGEVDFVSGITALLDAGYSGVFSLELETDDVTENDRPQEARRAGEAISAILDGYAGEDKR